MTTVVTRLCSNSILDLDWTTNEILVANLNTTIGITYHYVVHFNINVTTRTRLVQSRNVWNYKKADSEAAMNFFQDSTEEYFATPHESR